VSTQTGTATPRATTWVVAGAVVLVVALVAGTVVGPAGPTWWRVPLALLDRLPFVTIDAGITEREWSIVWQIRAPRVVLAALVGAMLSMAGASYQGVFRNPLVDPYLLGVAAGAGLGATVVFVANPAMLANLPIDPVPLAAFVGGTVAVLLTYLVGTAFGSQRSATTLVLAGVAVTALATAVQTFVLQRNTDVVRQVYSWILGRLSSATWGDVRLIAPYVIVSMIVLIAYRRVLDVMRVGDEEATALGTNVKRTRLIIVLAATLGTSAAVSVSGLIGFVGIIVPHASARRQHVPPRPSVVDVARCGLPHCRRHSRARAHRSGRDADRGRHGVLRRTFLPCTLAHAGGAAMKMTLRSVRVTYDGCPAVVAVDVSASSGEWLCVIGPNGAGKSSLLKSIVGIVPHEGSVDVDGRVLGEMGARERARCVAYVPQSPVLPDDMTVTDYVLLGRNPYVSTFGRETSHDHEIVAETLADLDLSVFARRRLSTLSGGERQRLVIARPPVDAVGW